MARELDEAAEQACQAHKALQHALRGSIPDLRAYLHQAIDDDRQLALARVALQELTHRVGRRKSPQ